MGRGLRIACFLAGALCAPLYATVLWDVDGEAPMRIDPSTGVSRSFGEPGRVDAIVPLLDGGAIMRRGSELIRVDPALEVVARTSVASSGPLHWDEQSRRLWVAAGSDVLRYDEQLRLDGVVRFDGEVRGLAGSGPDAVWVATAAQLVRLASDGSVRETLGVPSLGVAGRLAGVLADTARARVWVVATSRDAFAVDVSERMRPTRQRETLPPDAHAVAVEPRSGALLHARGRSWFAQRAIDGFAIGGPAEASDALRPGGPLWSDGAAPVPHPALAATSPVVLLHESPDGRMLRTAPVPVALSVGPPVQEPVAGGTRWTLELEARCGATRCADADALLATVRATSDAAGRLVDAKVVKRDQRWFILATLAPDLPAGTHPLAVSVVDAFGNRSVFDDHEVIVELRGDTSARRVVPKATPVVAITSPANGAVLVAPATVALAANASVSGATLARVEFLRNGTLLAADTTSPYAYNWSNVAAGSYALTAKAYDNAGGVATSSTVSITVKANVAPSVALAAPAPNAVFTAPATINLSASASDPDGTIAKVEFFNGTTRLATDTTSPYGHVWTGVGGGTYALKARATDDKGAATASTPISVIVNRPPTTAITAPSSNATLVAPVNVAVKASAADADGTVAKVEFLRNGTLAATDTSAPYSFAWNNVPLGTHTLTSRATDNRGATTTSAPVSFTVNANVAPSVTITSPAPGARFVHPASVPIAATASDSDGSIARVEFHYDYGFLGSDASNPYAHTWNSPYTGTFQLSARAVDNKGAVTVSAPVPVTIDPNQPPVVALVGDPPAGEFVAAQPPTFVLTAAAIDTDGTIASVRFLRYDASVDDFVAFATITQPPYTTQYVASSLESDYQFRAEAVDNAGLVGSADIVYWIVDNRAPEVQLLEPGNEVEWSGFIAPATVVVVAEAKDFDPVPDGVVRVDVLVDGSLIGSLASPNGAHGEYVHVWRDVAPGSYTIAVRAVDDFGNTGEWSRTVNVLAAGPNATVMLAQPASGQVHTASVPLQASVTPGSVPVARVDYVNTWGRKIATSAVAPFAATWSNPEAGRHAVTAIAVQSNGVAVSSPTVFVDVADAGTKRAPLVVLTAPGAGAVLGAGSPLTVTAEALADAGATITGVEFFSNGIPIGAATSPPFAISWTNPPPGSATLTAKATDNSAPAVNSTGTSSPITVTLGSANPAPTVSLTAPASGTAYAAPATVALAASATDSNGTVAKVDFHANGALVGTDATPPFAFTWNVVTAGTYSITATATDNGGASTTSAARAVTVVSNTPPQVTLTAPTAGQLFAFGAPVTLTASATDAEGTIAKVEFLDGSTALATDTAAPYTFTWTSAAPGSHAVAARATDSLGAIATTAATAITITANALPGVSLVLPRHGQRFVAGQPVELVATADDADGTVARVEFLAGSTLLGSVTTAPYTFTWTNIPSGTFQITARAVDNRGAVRTSGTATIGAGPLSASVTAPAENAQIASGFTTVHGTITAPPNSGVLVNGRRAHVEGYRFLANDVPLGEGANTIRVTVVTADGSVATQTRNVVRTGTAPLRVYLDGEAGFAPHVATLRVDNPSGLAITHVAFESLGSATVDTTGADQTTLGRLALSLPGVAAPTIVITDAAGTVHRQTVGLIATSRVALDALLKEVWNTHAAALVGGRVDLALATLAAVTAARYKPILEPLASHFGQIVPTWSPPQTGRLADDVAEYTIARTIDGQKRLFFVYLVRDGQGVWRLDSM